MTERAYPREWFRASKWDNEPLARMFDRETDAFLICGDGRRSKKWTDYDRWYPAREEAQAAIDERLANKAERERMNRIRDAAHDLLEALEALANAEYEYRYMHDLHGDDDLRAGRAWDWMRRKGDDARAAIAKARGEAA